MTVTGQQDQKIQAIVVEDMPFHALIALEQLQSVGFTVETTDNLLDARDKAFRMLDMSRPYMPTLILIDLMLIHPGQLELEGSLLAAELKGAMEQGLLHEAPLVAITAEPTPERLMEALLAGCRLCLRKPLDLRQAITLQKLTAQQEPPSWQIPEQLAQLSAPELQLVQERTQGLLRRSARQVFKLLQQVPAIPDTRPAWDVEHARMLLHQPGDLLAQEPWGTWVRGQGGYGEVCKYLRKHVLLADREQQLLFSALLNKPSPSWETLAKKIQRSRATVYRHLTKIYESVSLALNELEGS